MKIAAGIIGLITGFLSLMYVGVFGGLIGSAAGWLSSFDPNGGELSSWASMVKTLSYVAPVLLLAGGGVTFARPPFGGILLALGAIAHWYLLGFGVLGNLFILPSVLAAVLAFSSASGSRRSADTVRETSQTPPYPPKGTMDACPACGGQNAPSARFCGECGASLAESQTKKAYTAAPAAPATTTAPPIDFSTIVERWREIPARVRMLLLGILLLIAMGLIAGRFYYASHPAVPGPSGEPVQTSAGASFACEAARTWSERVVCADAALANQDKILAALYKQVMASRAGAERRRVRLDQRRWLQAREECAGATAPTSCLQDLYVRRIEALRVPTAYTASHAVASAPMFAPGTGYRDVRLALIKMGWQPINVSHVGTCGTYSCPPFPEVLACTGVGQAPCTYTWRRDGAILMVSAIGENYGNQAFSTIERCSSVERAPLPIGGWKCRTNSVGSSEISETPKTYTDAVAYCRAVGTVDQPGKTYRGPAAPNWMFAQMGIRPDRKIANGSWPLIWRCYHGAVLACEEGGSHPICGPKSRNRHGTKAFWDYCRENPNAPFLPGAVGVGESVFDWACSGTRPVPTQVVYHVDERGYPLDAKLWKIISPPNAATGR